MAQSSVGQASGHNYTTSATQLKYRTKNSGNPLQHDDVDANFDILRKAINGVISDVDGVVDRDLTADLSNASLGYTQIGKNYPVLKSYNKLFVNVPWLNTTYSAGNGLTLSSTTFSHADTSSQTTSNNSGRTVIQDITLDGYGHVTGLGTVTLSDTNTTYGVAGTSLGLVKEGGDIDIDADGNMTIKDGAVDASAFATTVNLGGGGTGSGFQHASSMCAGAVVTGAGNLADEAWIFVVNYGGSTGGYHLAQYNLNTGVLVSQLLPSSAAGTGSTSWPFKHTSSWAAAWPMIWVNGAVTGNTAEVWFRHHGSYVNKFTVNRTTGVASITNDTVNGVHAAGSNYFGSQWQLVAKRSNDDFICCYGFPSGGTTQMDHVSVSRMEKGNANTPYGSQAYSYTGVTRYLPKMSDKLTNGPANLTLAQAYSSHVSVAGINPATGRVYIKIQGGVDEMQVWQLTTPVGSSAYKYYEAFNSILRSTTSASRSGFDYVKSFAIPDAFYQPNTNQTGYYQIQFAGRGSDSESTTPIYITSGNHNVAWNYGGQKVIPWRSEWT